MRLLRGWKRLWVVASLVAVCVSIALALGERDLFAGFEGPRVLRPETLFVYTDKEKGIVGTAYGRSCVPYTIETVDDKIEGDVITVGGLECTSWYRLLSHLATASFVSVLLLIVTYLFSRAKRRIRKAI